MQKRWNTLEFDESKFASLRTSLKINPALTKILVQRGVLSFDDAKRFFRPQLSELHDPWLMKDMKKAVDRILSAFNNEEKILMFGDYDVDGTTSVACMFSFLRTNYLPELIDFYIPHRYREGYGV